MYLLRISNTPAHGVTKGAMIIHPVFTFALLAWVAKAQTSTSSTSVSQPTVDPSSLNSTTKNAWCDSQKRACVSLCDGVADLNTCEPDDLSFQCECFPITKINFAAYRGTIPTFECEYAESQCAQNSQKDCSSYSCATEDAWTSTASSATAETPSTTRSSSRTAFNPYPTQPSYTEPQSLYTAASEGGSDKSSVSVGAVVGAVVASILGTALLMSVGFYVLRNRRRTMDVPVSKAQAYGYQEDTLELRGYPAPPGVGSK